MDRSIIFEDFRNGAAVAEPKEFSTPEKFPVLTDGPTTATGFSDEGMIVALTLVQPREPNRIGRRRAPFIVTSKLQMPSDRKRASSAAEASESSGCIKIQPMPVPAQSVFKNKAWKYRSKQGKAKN